MPVRTFRTFLSNHTEFELHLTANELCAALGGDSIWTSAEWTPPSIIPPRTERGWQAESSGLATGTQGFVKYRIARPASVIPGGHGEPPPPTLTDEIYLYWNNPFLGGHTAAKCAIDPVAVSLNCDPERQATGGGNVFNPPEIKSDFEIIPSSPEKDHPDWTNCGTLDGDAASITEVPLAEVLVFSNFEIIEHAWARFILRRVGSTRQSLTLNADPSLGIRRILPPATFSFRTAFRI